MDPFCVKSWTFLLPLLLFVVIVTDTNGFECYTCPALTAADSPCTTLVECAASTGATGGGCTIESSKDSAGAMVYDRGCREKDVVKTTGPEGCSTPTEIDDANKNKPAGFTNDLVTYCFCDKEKCNMMMPDNTTTTSTSTMDPGMETTTPEDSGNAGTVQIASALLTISYITICFVSNFSQ